jgi:hypothetical protein
VAARNEIPNQKWYSFMIPFFREMGADSTDSERVRNLENTVHGMVRCTDSIHKGLDSVEKKLTTMCHNNELSLEKMEKAHLKAELKREAANKQAFIKIIGSMLLMFTGLAWWMFEMIVSELGR